jgi:hypothetical protein
MVVLGFAFHLPLVVRVFGVHGPSALSLLGAGSGRGGSGAGAVLLLSPNLHDFLSVHILLLLLTLVLTINVEGAVILKSLLNTHPGLLLLSRGSFRRDGGSSGRGRGLGRGRARRLLLLFLVHLSVVSRAESVASLLFSSQRNHVRVGVVAKTAQSFSSVALPSAGGAAGSSDGGCVDVSVDVHGSEHAVRVSPSAPAFRLGAFLVLHLLEGLSGTQSSLVVVGVHVLVVGGS